MKNTWELNLIDYIDDVLDIQAHDKDNPELTNFQVASTTLDASAKIYASRVDSVHVRTYKVLGGLSRTESKRGGKKKKKEKRFVV